MSGCLESTFELASKSRLPRWTALPHGLTRTDVLVTMNYYTMPLGPDANFILKDRKGIKLAEKWGKIKCQSGTSDYPLYNAVVVDGITEIIEHKWMEPIFYVTDDPAVTKALLAACPGLTMKQTP
jgi:hypothetical protein